MPIYIGEASWQSVLLIMNLPFIVVFDSSSLKGKENSKISAPQTMLNKEKQGGRKANKFERNCPDSQMHS